MTLSSWVKTDTGWVAQVVEDSEETSTHVASPADAKENVENFGFYLVFVATHVCNLAFKSRFLKMNNTPRGYTEKDNQYKNKQGLRRV